MNKLLVIFLSTAALSAEGQNLIPNGDFELGPDSTSIGWQYGVDSFCSLQISFVAGPTFWTVTTGSPDRFINVPCPGMTGSAKSGNAHIILGGGYSPPFTYLNEGGKATLINPIETDSLYRLGFYCRIDTFGYCYSDTGAGRFLFVFNGGDSILFSYFSHPDWQYYDTVFTPLYYSTEIEIRTIDNAPLTYCAEIDSIFLVKISSTSISNIFQNEKHLEIFPNPADNIVYLLSKDTIVKAEIHNIFGQLIFTETTSTVHTEGLPNGTYFLKVIMEKHTLTKKVLIQHFH